MRLAETEKLQHLFCLLVRDHMTVGAIESMFVEHLERADGKDVEQ